MPAWLSNLQADDILTFIASCLLAIPGIIALINQQKKTKGEVEKTDAETEKIHAEIAEKYAKQVSDLIVRQEEQDKKIGVLQTKISGLEQENNDLRSWASRLANQVISLGKEPVPFVNTRAKVQ